MKYKIMSRGGVLKKLLFCLVLCCLFPKVSAATTDSVYLRNSIGAKPVSMGDAFAGFGADANSVFYNPASLARMTGYSLFLSHIEFIQGARYEVASGAAVLGNNSAMALTCYYISNGSQEKRDINGILEGEFTPIQIVPMLSFAGAVTEQISLGANVKLPYEVIDDFSSLKVLFDIAGFIKLDDNFSAGINLQNIGTYNNLPVNLKAGIGFRSGPLRSGFDVNIPDKADVIYNAGAEYMVIDNLFVRAGLKYQYNSTADFYTNFSFGFGYKIEIFTIDYGFRMFDTLGNTHFISILFNL